MNFLNGLISPEMLLALLASRGLSISSIDFNDDEQRIEVWLRTRQGPQYRELTYTEIRQFFGCPKDGGG